MSPASYLTAPPRVAATRIASFFVPWWTWIALGLFVAAVATGAAVAVVSLRRLRRARASRDQLAAAVEALAHKTEELERRLDRAGDRAELVERRVAHLQASMERLSVLGWALGDVTKTISQLRSAATLRK
jgi:uncharacterized protein YqfA (UPF0365 family)